MDSSNLVLWSAGGIKSLSESYVLNTLVRSDLMRRGSFRGAPAGATIRTRNDTFNTSRFDHDNPKTILNLALRSFILFNIDRCLGGGG
jgi:hypothetical protein